MSSHESLPTNPDQSTAQPYDTAYYMHQDGTPRNAFGFNTDRDIARAQAVVDAIKLPPDSRILDYGCGLGGMTAAFNMIGYDALGVDPSPDAARHALPETRIHGREAIQCLGKKGLDEFANDSFDLVFLKDVFEHIDENELPYIVDDLMCIGKQVLSIIPVTDDKGKFIFERYEDDPTHINRLTRNYWLGFFPYTTVRDLAELTPQVRRADKIEGTLSLFLSESPDHPVLSDLRQLRERRSRKKWWQKIH